MGNIAKGRKMKLWVGRIAGHFVNINNIANSEQWSPDLGLGRQGVQQGFRLDLRVLPGFHRAWGWSPPLLFVIPAADPPRRSIPTTEWRRVCSFAKGPQ